MNTSISDFSVRVTFAAVLLLSCDLIYASTTLICHDHPHDPSGTIYVLDTEGDRAFIPSSDGRREGRLTTTNDFYKIEFKGSESKYPLEISINQHTGDFELEFGDEPFWNYSLKNVYRTGTCQLLKEPKL